MAVELWRSVKELRATGTGFGGIHGGPRLISVFKLQVQIGGLVVILTESSGTHRKDL